MATDFQMLQHRDILLNELFGAIPQTQQPLGTQLVIEGRTSDQIVWLPQIVRVATSGGRATSSGGQISFSPGDPGCCGGQDVSAGQVIGASGNTGNSSDPHLHFEVCYNDVPQGPSYTVAL